MKKHNLVILILMLFANQTAWGDTLKDSIYMQFDIEPLFETYQNVELDGTTYRQLTVEGNISGKTWSTGLTSKIFGEETIKHKMDKVPGDDGAGYSKVTLAQRNNITYAVFESLSDNAAAANQHPSKYKAEVKFTKGNWEDYIKGKKVELKLTEKGKQSAFRAMSADLRPVLKEIEKGLLGIFPKRDRESKEVEVEVIKTVGDSKIEGDKDFLKISYPAAEIRLRLDVHFTPAEVFILVLKAIKKESEEE